MTERYDAVDPGVPLLLLPLRLETRSEQITDEQWDLRVRVYPDDVSMCALERELSIAEIEAAKQFWTDRWRDLVLRPEDPPAPDRWLELVATIGPVRAPWAAAVMRPTNPSDRGVGLPVFPNPPDRAPGGAPPPRAVLLPDVLRVVVVQSGTTVSELGRPIAADGVATGSAGGDVEALGKSLGELIKERPDRGDPLAWITDFDAAEEVGLAIRIRLPHGNAAIERVSAVGVRTAGDPDATASELDWLLEAHRYGAGSALPAVGTVTNNTPSTRAAWSRLASRPGAPPLDPPFPNSRLAAGPQLASALGLPGSAFAGWDGADDLGALRAGAMSRGLWPVTWGGFLDRVLARPLAGRTTAAVRHHVQSVRGRGPLPPVRLGRQPYGILPVTSLSSFTDEDPTVSAIAGVLRRLGPLWHAAAASVPHVGAGDLGSVLPEILGQGPVSRSVRVRRAVGLGGPLGMVAEKVDPAELAGRTMLVRIAESIMGLAGGTLGDPIALGVERLLGLPLADASDPDVLRAILAPGGHRGDYTSVLQVLLALSEGQTRAALERLTERERLQIMASRLQDSTGELGEELVQIGLEALDIIGNGGFEEIERLQRAADSFDTPDVPWSADRFFRRFPIARLRPHPIDAAQGQDASAVAEAVAVTLRAATAYADVRQSIAVLAEVPADDERGRLLAETLDCASHRYDAWVTSLATRRLESLRADRPSGVTIGAYGVVEHLEIQVAPAEGDAIIAPSTAHAATAAVLRGARLTHAPLDDAAGALEIDLTSTRVRAAMAVLEGVRAGQPLGALLGYRFERALHEAHSDHRLNKYVPTFRTLAPLVAAKSTDRVATGAAPAALESVAATEVVDGLRLREIYLDELVGEPGPLDPDGSIVTRLGTPPPGFERYGVGPWAAPDADELDLIVGALAGLDDLLDALSDLLLAEGVHQLVRGDPARAAAAMDAMAGDALPSEPDVLSPPPTGAAFTHRLLVLSQARSSSLLNGWTSTPRAVADPSLEAWARTALGPASSVVLAVDADGAPTAALSAARMSALELVAATGGSPGLAWARLQRAVPGLPDVPLTTRPPGLPATATTFGEAWVLAGSLRALLAGARPALPVDLAPPGEEADRLRGVDLVDLRKRAERSQTALAEIPTAPSGPVQLLLVADRLAGFGLGGGVDPGTLEDTDLALHVAALLAERARRVESTDAALLAYDGAPPTQPDAAFAALVGVINTVFGDRLPVLPVLGSVQPTTPDAFVAAWRRPSFQTPDGAAIRPWLATAAMVRPAAARLAETLMLREALRGPHRLRVVQMAEAEQNRWVGLPFQTDRPPRDAVTAYVVDAPSALQPRARCVGLVVDGWTEVVPRRRDTPAAEHLVTAGVAVHANGPDSRAPQALLLAVTPDRQPWTWERVAGIVEETVALARARLVTLERAPLGGALLPAIWAQDWSLQGEPVIDPRLLSEFADARAVMSYVRELEQ